MTYRDPLYDKNPPASGDSLEESLADRNTGQKASDKAKSQGDQMKQKGKEAADQAKNKADEIGSKAQDKADEIGSKAQDKADEGMDKAASGLGAAADKLRDQGDEQGGKAGSYANTVADKLESASAYMREKDSDQILTDLEDLVRRKPMESLLAAAGIGLLLSRIIK